MPAPLSNSLQFWLRRIAIEQNKNNVNSIILARSGDARGRPVASLAMLFVGSALCLCATKFVARYGYIIPFSVIYYLSSLVLPCGFAIFARRAAARKRPPCVVRAGGRDGSFRSAKLEQKVNFVKAARFDVASVEPRRRVQAHDRLAISLPCQCHHGVACRIAAPSASTASLAASAALFDEGIADCQPFNSPPVLEVLGIED
jgi:hypothetical protein